MCALGAFIKLSNVRHVHWQPLLGRQPKARLHTGQTFGATVHCIVNSILSVNANPIQVAASGANVFVARFRFAYCKWAAHTWTKDN